MTLIVSWLGRDFVMQSSDRLVTTPPRAAFDTEANKTVVYAASDGFVAISYVGAAFVGTVTTDQWIAETLMRRRYATDGVRWNASPLRLDPWFDSGRAAHDLMSAANTAIAPSPDRDHYLELMMTGWQRWKRPGFYRPYLWTISNDHGAFEILRHSAREPLHGQPTRTQPFSFPMELAATPALNFSADVATNVTELIRTGGGRRDYVESALVAGIRQAAGTHPGIGTDIMSVVLAPRRAHIRYFPVQAPRRRLTYAKTAAIRTVAYSPWVIGPRLAVAPGITTGGQQLLKLGFGVLAIIESRIVMRDDPGGLIFSLTGQPRPRRP
jgi:hypothetical protein